MKRIVISSFLVFGLLFAGSSGSYGRTQEKQEKAAKQQQEKLAAEASAKEEATRQESKSAPEGPLLQVKIVFSEFEGEKKVKSLPYTLLVREPLSWSKIRMGSRVPVATGSGSSNMPVQWQYIDVGTNIDCRAAQVPDGRYRLSLTMERSWAEGEASGSEVKPASTETRTGEFHQPVIRQFRSDSEIIIRAGQTLETNFATDPVSGKVIRIEVTLEVLK